MKRNAAIESQFNWIFVLVVGAVILIFFITFINNQRKNSEILTASDLLTHFDSIARGATVSIGTIYDIDIPSNIEFE